MSKFASGGGGQALRKAGSSYVRAKGGAVSAARSASAGKAATQGLAGFLSNAARNGIGAALNSLGLQNLVGADVDTVFAGVVNALANGVTDFDQVIARAAMTDAFNEFYEKSISSGNLDSLNHLSNGEVSEAIESIIVSYIYNRWLQELGSRIENNAISEREAVRLEDEMKDYVKDAVHLELAGSQTLEIDWAGDEGRTIIDDLYEEAYRFIERGG